MNENLEGFAHARKSALAVFGQHLRRLRLGVGMTQDQCAAELGYSAQHFGNMEAGRRLPQESFVVAAEELLDEGKVLHGLWRLARDQATGVARPAEFVEAEARATAIHTYQAHLVPQLLQEPSYIAAVAASVRPPLPPAEIDVRVASRTTRQELLSRRDPPTLWAIVDEAVLHREIGGRAVMRAQLGHLAERAAQHTVTVQVLPFEAPTSPALGATFTILSLAGRDAAYVESPGGEATWPETFDAVSRHRTVFDHLRAAALSEAASLALIQRRLADYG